MTSEERDVVLKLRAIYDMYYSLKKPRQDDKVLTIIEEEIAKIQKCDYMYIKNMESKYVDFLINQKIKSLRKKYQEDEKTEEEIALELEDLAALKMHVKLKLEPENVDVFFKGKAI